MDILQKLTQEFSVKLWQVENAVKLIDDGNTIPFIARYRKEATGSLDDQLLRDLSDRLTYLRNMEEQKEKIIASIEEQELMTDEIMASIESASTLTELEDIYRPFRPKRKTRASVAKAKGLQGLADFLYAQDKNSNQPLVEAEKYLNDEVESVEDAINGAKDIIAEFVSDDPAGRKMLRYSIKNHGNIVVTGAKDELGVYEMYREYTEPISNIASHRVLAFNRGEKEGFLKVNIDYDKNTALTILYNLHIKDSSPTQELVKEAIEDSYTRLIFPSVERELRNSLSENADDKAIKVFAENTRHLLMQPPVKGKVTLGLDPGYRTGCKVAVVDATGKVLDTSVIYAVPPHNKVEQAKKIIKDLVKKHNVQMFAIGNGTASHETEVFACEVIKELNCGITYMVVSEAGASVYSASKLAAKEFPEYDVSLRSAVSIARRLQDPLAELVKIDPKAIGVGQYQHDMPQNRLSSALDGVVEDCVNTVGVDLNTASAQLLSRVAGVSSKIADNIVKYRQEHGIFKSRDEIMNVSMLGPKAFEQCAGFLRVSESKNVLDNTAVHPESYDATRKLLKLCSVTDEDVRSGNVSAVKQYVETVGTSALAKQLDIGEPTLIDITKEIAKPGRDPRDELPAPMLRTDVMDIKDLKVGMELKGTVRNVIDFGAFVDVGVHQDGLVHISQITDKYIKHPSDVLKVGDIVTVWVISVDVDKKRIGLSMKKPKE
ncbi:MAG TPA: RNA-binding transcriptional accessory protein [Oscillospiraceae bacterium]|jgi:uncharacterized protein|nr:RNA-binding transcriptional accessory protein [Oscillospiraceae bacterium]